MTNVSPVCFCHPTVGNFDVSPYSRMIKTSWEILVKSVSKMYEGSHKRHFVPFVGDLLSGYYKV